MYCKCNNHIHAGLLLCNFFLRDFAVMQLENLRHFSNLHYNFRFNTVWHRQSVATLIFCRRLAESDITVMPPVTCGLRWRYDRVAHVVSCPTALFILTTWARNVNLHHLVDSKWKIGKGQSVLRRLHLKSQLEKGEWIVDTYRNVRLADNSLHTIHDYADRESAKSGTKVVVRVARLSQSYQNELYQELWMWVCTLLLH